ncbi:hypothetical protein AU381_16775 [Sinorhizobium glycinis]|uniref:DUF2971 domain-containing protein n=1 Tax=Sinorhizobium glycinis TaxID=1472378 RepID=A0A178XKU3_9HYPH|nr:DUF2971 domain-containing protein [Sinorhizobium glycinis]OAP35836.1 hypothetical protein AU381_16775 [Sinorhizobium glycinis]
MILYKYRALNRYTDEIIESRRLFCANWGELNDPMEGMFEFFSSDHHDRRYLEDIIRHKNEFRVCSLSKVKYSHLLWAHYADQFRGVLIAVDIPVPAADLVEVYYRSSHSFPVRRNWMNTETVARRILSSKHKDWSYEKEVRILSREEYFPIPIIRHVTLGIRSSRSDDERVMWLCRDHRIPVYKLRLTDEGLEERPIDEYYRARADSEAW